jgi:glutaredoxin
VGLGAHQTPAELAFEPGTPAVLTYAGERGAFTDASKIDDVPEGSRGMVRVTLVGGEQPPAGQVWVANLRTPDPEGNYRLSTVPRDRFEELALGQGLSSTFELPEGLEPPESVAAIAPGQVIVYKTAWCGVCKQVEAYLRRKGVDYVAKDIEKDRAAAAELQAKASEGGVRTGSVPIIDIGGELIVGFDRARLEKLLAG